MSYTDKAVNGYLPTYLGMASQIGTRGSVLELGIDQGGSLELWLTLFPEGNVVGVDHNPLAHVPEGAIGLFTAQDNPGLPARLDHLAPFDLVVDDASHRPGPTTRSFDLLWPLVAPGRWYVIEDWGVAFEGLAPMYEPDMIEVAKGFIEAFAHQSRGVAAITYRPGMIILEKVT